MLALIIKYLGDKPLHYVCMLCKILALPARRQHGAARILGTQPDRFYYCNLYCIFKSTLNLRLTSLNKDD